MQMLNLERVLPRERRRDTAEYQPLMRARARTSGRGLYYQPKSLRALALEELGVRIQYGEHCPVQDARAALYVYLKHRKRWEASV